jgi:hypothetical protein
MTTTWPNQAAAHAMAMTQHEAEEEAHSAVEHTFGYVLDHVRAERAALGLPPEFEFVCLVHSHSVPFELGTQFVDAFTSGQPLALPHGSPLIFARDQEQLYRALLPLYERGEHDASYYDYSRTDSSLLHIHHVHCGPAC